VPDHRYCYVAHHALLYAAAPTQAAYYCCKEHQARDWKQHKQVCKHLQQLAAQEAAAAGSSSSSSS
jgi:hypothetical protein